MVRLFPPCRLCVVRCAWALGRRLRAVCGSVRRLGRCQVLCWLLRSRVRRLRPASRPCGAGGCPLTVGAVRYVRATLPKCSKMVPPSVRRFGPFQFPSPSAWAFSCRLRRLRRPWRRPPPVSVVRYSPFFIGYYETNYRRW